MLAIQHDLRVIKVSLQNIVGTIDSEAIYTKSMPTLSRPPMVEHYIVLALQGKFPVSTPARFAILTYSEMPRHRGREEGGGGGGGGEGAGGGRWSGLWVVCSKFRRDRLTVAYSLACLLCGHDRLGSGANICLRRK